jgi:hypothetical protein
MTYALGYALHSLAQVGNISLTNTQLTGTLLWNTIIKQDFEGATGRVAFDKNGDRITKLNFINFQVSSAPRQSLICIGEHMRRYAGRFNARKNEGHATYLVFAFASCSH